MFRWFLTIFSVISLVLSPAANVRKNESAASVNHASWTRGAHSQAEIEEMSDIIMLGHVIDSVTQMRSNVVFTMYTIKADEFMKSKSVKPADTVDVLITGGEYGTNSTPFIDGVCLENDTEYVLFLQYVHDEQYGDYYLITGGYQGFCPEKYYLNDTLPVFNDRVNQPTRANTPRMNPAYKWNLSTLKVLVPSSIATTYTSYVRNGICDGVSSWPLCSDAPNVTIQSSSGGGSNVAVSMQNFGSTGWDALTTTYYNSSTLICSSATMQVNVYYRNTNAYLTERIFWKAVCSHEMGHALGLDHNTDYSVTSVMRPYTDDYYVINASWPKIATGRPADINTMNTIY